MSEFHRIIDDAVKEYSLTGFLDSRRELEGPERTLVEKQLKGIAAREKDSYKRFLSSFRNILMPILKKTEFETTIRPESLDPKKEVIVYLSNHKCHLDELATVANIYLEGYPYPLVAAGENLFTNRFVEHVVKSLGGFKIRRSFLNDKAYTNKVSAYLSACMMNNRPLMFYPEGTRPRDGNLKDLDKGFIHLVNSSFSNVRRWEHFRKTDLKFVPVHIDYSYNPDESYLTKDPASKGEKTNIVRQWRTKQKKVDHAHIAMGDPLSHDQFFQGSDPKNPENLGELCKEIKSRMKNIGPVFKEHLVYKALKMVDENNMDYRNVLEMVYRQLEVLEKDILGKGKKVIIGPDYDTCTQIKKLDRRGVIGISGSDSFTILKPKTIDYYANSVDTLLDRPPHFL